MIWISDSFYGFIKKIIEFVEMLWSLMKVLALLFMEEINNTYEFSGLSLLNLNLKKFYHLSWKFNFVSLIINGFLSISITQCCES